MLCNARDTRTLVLDVVETADAWNRDAEDGKMARAQTGWTETLKARPVGFKTADCAPP